MRSDSDSVYVFLFSEIEFFFLFRVCMSGCRWFLGIDGSVWGFRVRFSFWKFLCMISEVVRSFR